MLDRLGHDERKRCLAFYEAVEEANYLSQQAGLLFVIAQLAEGEAAGGLEDEALRLSTTPYLSVIEAAAEISRGP